MDTTLFSGRIALQNKVKWWKIVYLKAEWLPRSREAKSVSPLPGAGFWHRLHLNSQRREQGAPLQNLGLETGGSCPRLGQLAAQSSSGPPTTARMFSHPWRLQKGVCFVCLFKKLCFSCDIKHIQKSVQTKQCRSVEVWKAAQLGL